MASESLVHVVVHGTSGAGKSTTARSLGERLGLPVTTPEEDERGRTTLFDWVEYVGGRFDGRPIRTRVITVPGHDAERHRRLLALADVVLFVVDSRPGRLEASCALLAEVRGIVSHFPEAPPVVVQVNHRDAADAVPLEEVRDRLALAPGADLVETVASSGDGVRQAFVFAVRGALRRGRGPIGAAADLPLDPETLAVALERAVPRPRAGASAGFSAY